MYSLIKMCFLAVRVSTGIREVEITLARLVAPKISTGAVVCGSVWVGGGKEAEAGEVGDVRTQEGVEGGEGVSNGEEVEGGGGGGGGEGAGDNANMAECRLGIYFQDILS